MNSSIIERRLKILRDNFNRIFNEIKNKKILITGANGFIGSVLCLVLHEYASVFCLVRSREKMIKRFNAIYGDVSKIVVFENFKEFKEEVDIVIHCAAPVQSNFFIKNPIDTLDSIYTNTKEILDFSIQKKIKKFVFLSTMEIYGDIVGEDVGENNIGRFAIENLRNSYPLAKQMSEFLVYAYFKQYVLSSDIIRLTQTIGPTASINDNRVYMDFIRSAIKDSKIILLTNGETKREYIDVFDVVMGIIFAICNGRMFEIYNLSNPDNFISVYELAKMISTKLKAEIIFDFQQDTSLYLSSFVRKLNCKKIQKLGWKPLFNLEETLDDMIAFVR